MAKRKRTDDRMLLVNGETVASRSHHYVIEQLVGTGSYAAVYMARDDLGRKVALKEFFPVTHPRDAPMLKGLFERERHVLSLVSAHPLMPGYYEGFQTEQHYYLAQEFIEGKTLEEIISRTKLDREWMLRWAVSLCYALSYLHGLEIVHHDLKPANIKIRPDGHLALLDFGAARYFGKRDDTLPDSLFDDDDLFGTEGYLPPELEADGNFAADVRTDIFAMGAVLYEMVMGDPPEQKSINERNLFITTPLMERRDVDLAYVKLVTTALSYNTEFRYANVNLFLDALRPISPPVFLVSTKTLSFGQVAADSAPVQRKFVIFNGGSGGEFVGDVRSRAPWLKVEMPAFRGSRREMVITAEPSKVPGRNQIARGEIEVWAAEKRDGDNHVINKSERWIIECKIAVTPRPAALSLPETASGEPLVFRVRKNAPSQRTIVFANSGEETADVAVSIDGHSGITVTPPHVQIPSGGTASVILGVAGDAVLNGKPEQEATLLVHSGKQVALTARVILRAASLMDSLKGLLGR